MNSKISAAVVISQKGTSGRRHKDLASQCQVSVAVRVPRKRHGLGDPIQNTLKCYLFLDDTRLFSNLDALFTRFPSLGNVYIACTEAAEILGNVVPNSEQKNAISKTNKLLDKICTMIESRDSELSVNSFGPTDESKAMSSIVAHKLLSLGKPLQREEDAIVFTDQVMTRLLSPDNIQGERDDSKSAVVSYRGNRTLAEVPLTKQALGLLLRELGMDSTSALDDHASRRYVLEMGRLDSHLQMDRVAAEAIHLLPPPRNAHNPNVGSSSNNRSTTSIYGLLNHCKTQMGTRLLDSWLRQPLVNHEEIVRRHDVVEFFVDRSVELNQLRSSGLKNIMDLDLLASQVIKYGSVGSNLSSPTSNSCVSLEVLYRMYLFADQQLPLLRLALEDILQASLKESDGPGAIVCRNFSEELERIERGLQKIKGLTEAVLDLAGVPRAFLVKPNFDSDLQSLREELEGIESQLKELHQAMNEEWVERTGCPNSAHVRLETTDNYSGYEGGCAWQFRLPNTNDEKVLREEFGSSVQVHRVLKNGVYFSTKALRELGTAKQDILMEYQRRQSLIVEQAMKVAATFCPVLEQASLIISELDVLASFAHVAAYGQGSTSGGYCRPTMTDTDADGSGITLINARHPCVELQEGIGDFIPNNFTLLSGSSSFQIITGPNMGGKSTYIRSLGAIVAMAQAGSFVPCESATINIVDCILARVGAGDAQQRGISTFMAEMLEASGILQSATKRSLIIIDELGRGTSTHDGFGLAWAISEYIVKHIGCSTLFATHFHELTELEQHYKCVKNCHVTAIKRPGSNGLTFLYEVRPGPCLESFGIQVAELAKFPPSVIANAKRKAKKLENFGSCSSPKKIKSVTHPSSHDLVRRLKETQLNLIIQSEDKLAALGRLLGLV